MAKQVQLQTTALIMDDPDVSAIQIVVTLHAGAESKGLDSFVVERALFKYLGSPSFLAYLTYARDNGMKTL